MAGQFPGQFGPVLPAPPKGPFGVVVKVLLCLVAVLTAGLLGFVPAVALAVRRRRRADVLGAVVVGALSLLMFVCAVVAGDDKHATVANGLGAGTMVLLILGAPTHFLLMDRRRVWGGPAPVLAPVPLPGYWAPPPPPEYQLPPQQPVSAPVDELQQLGELLRRQAEGGGR
ncbi:hypothetical protein [Kitasatospora kifunensis]|uniref:Uncharacterized membrane protein YhaH (DUF805 family) n=1 Tax=Kitasatospora kifunensis TaxID=58351 RepID=A0A7W7VVV4_KITKI|nr:hypothetical protein [Kitasatospora kifunensis]MBB4923895.1 uncharacterized membrane protein YhaH (DUF805 family) [Kitasatospora kifunensis]